MNLEKNKMDFMGPYSSHILSHFKKTLECLVGFRMHSEDVKDYISFATEAVCIVGNVVL